MFAAGVPGLVLWCLGIPALFCAVLYRRRTALQQEKNLAALGFLYAGALPVSPMFM